MKTLFKFIINVVFILSIPFFFSAVAFADSGSDKPKIVAITQIVEHPSADAVRKGILDVLSENGYKNGDNLKILYENAQGNLNTATQIAKHFVSLTPDVIVPITTPSTQAMVHAAKHTTIPIVFAAVTDPLHAKLVDNLDHPGGNVTGTTEFPPVEKQVALIKQFLPYIKRLGIIYSSSEINSVKIVGLVKEKAKKLNIEVIEQSLSNTGEVGQAVQSLASKVEAIYVPLDNTVLSAMNTVLKASFAQHIPVFSSDPDSVKQGALASVSYTQYEAGRLAGEMVIRIFNGEKPGNIPVSSPALAKLSVNPGSALQLNIAIPEKILEKSS